MTSLAIAVAGVDGEEGVGVALGEVDDLGLVGLRVLADALGVAARARQDVVGVGLGLVARALLIGARALHVVEGVDHRQRRLDAQELDLGDLDAGVLGVEQRLQHRLRLVGDLLALVGHRRLDRRAADDVAQRAFGGDLHRRLGRVDAEQELAGVADLPEHGAVGLDDVLVAGQHLALASARRVAGNARVAELDLVDLRHLREKDRSIGNGRWTCRPGWVVSIQRPKRNTTPCSSGWTR